MNLLAGKHQPTLDARKHQPGSNSWKTSIHFYTSWKKEVGEPDLHTPRLANAHQSIV